MVKTIVPYQVWLKHPDVERIEATQLLPVLGQPSAKDMREIQCCLSDFTDEPKARFIQYQGLEGFARLNLRPQQYWNWKPLHKDLWK